MHNGTKAKENATCSELHKTDDRHCDGARDCVMKDSLTEQEHHQNAIGDGFKRKRTVPEHDNQQQRHFEKTAGDEETSKRWRALVEIPTMTKIEPDGLKWKQH
eukprot:m.13357 g.13357  ORF g.13357 m.13357 type:complete len:103 (+) comp10146_c0_seq5:269-577(+)